MTYLRAIGGPKDGQTIIYMGIEKVAQWMENWRILPVHVYKLAWERDEKVWKYAGTYDGLYCSQCDEETDLFGKREE